MEERLSKLIEVIRANQPIKRKDIQNQLYEYYPKTSDNSYNDSGLRRITKDVQSINSKIEYGLIIKGGSDGYRIITKESLQEDMDQELINILKRLKRHYAKMRKANLDGQIDIYGTIVKVFEEQK